MQRRRAEKVPTDPITMQFLDACQQQATLAVPRPRKTEHLSLEHGVGYGTAIGYSDNGRPRTRSWRERVEISGCLFPGRRGERLCGQRMGCYDRSAGRVCQTVRLLADKTTSLLRAPPSGRRRGTTGAGGTRTRSRRGRHEQRTRCEMKNIEVKRTKRQHKTTRSKPIPALIDSVEYDKRTRTKKKRLKKVDGS